MRSLGPFTGAGLFEIADVAACSMLRSTVSEVKDSHDSGYGDITRYDLDTRQPLTDLPGARGEVNTVQFSDDGKTCSLDQTVSIRRSH